MQNIKKIIYRNAVLFAAGWALVIFILCATPGRYIPSANWLELLSFDKFVHASIFFTLTALLFVVAIKYKKQAKVFALFFMLAVAYGGLLEMMQAKCFSDRSADWADMAANTFGCVIAILCLKKLKSIFG